jgi:hypothetical protein
MAKSGACTPYAISLRRSKKNMEQANKTTDLYGLQLEHMDNANNEEKIVDDDTGLNGYFVKFEKDKRKTVTIQNWRTVETIKTYDDVKRTSYEWRGDVIEEDGQKCKKDMRLSNFTFRKAVNKLLEGKDKTKQVKLSIKRIGEGKTTIYDVELAA